MAGINFVAVVVAVLAAFVMSTAWYIVFPWLVKMVLITAILGAWH
jgi:hypothetical protein